MGSLESRNAEYSAVVAEKEGLTTENQQLKANEEGLHCLLREKRKENTELQQAYDRQCQRLRDVAAYAEVSGTYIYMAVPLYINYIYIYILNTYYMQAVYNYTYNPFCMCAVECC